MFEIFGWTGAVLFACCGFPQAIKTYRTKKADDISLIFLLMWFWGEIFTLAYVFEGGYEQWPLIFNYIFNIVITIYLLYAKWRFS